MRALIILFPLVVFLHFIVVAQRNEIPSSLRSTEMEIVSRPGTDREILARSRAALREAVMNGQTSKTEQILAYIDARFDSSRVLSLWPQERVLADLWTGATASLLQDPRRALGFDVEGSSFPRRRITPDEDLLLDDLKKFTRDHRSDLNAKLVAAMPIEEERDLVNLIVDGLLGPSSDDAQGRNETVHEMNTLADRFLDRYPRSRHSMFVREHLRVVLRPSPWGYGLELGIGRVSLSGELQTWFEDSYTLDVAGEITYRNAAGLLRIALPVSGKVRAAFDYNGRWEQGYPARPYLSSVSLGYVCEVGPLLRITPHAGWTYVFISPTGDERSYGFDKTMDFGAFSAGLSIDLPVTSEPVPFSPDERMSLYFVRIRIGMQHSSTQIPFARGNMALFSVGLGGFGNPVERQF